MYLVAPFICDEVLTRKFFLLISAPSAIAGDRVNCEYQYMQVYEHGCTTPALQLVPFCVAGLATVCRTGRL